MMKKIAMISLTFMFLSTFFVSAGQAANIFTDDFSSGINSFYWTKYLENPNSTIVWDSGRVLMTQGRERFPGDDGGANLLFNFSASGDYTVRIDYALVNWTPDNHERAGIRTNFGAVERISDSRFYGERYVTDYSSIITTTGTTDVSGTLQFVRTGSIIEGYYWNAVISDWTLISTSPYAASGDLILELSIWPWTGIEGTQVAFDNFYLSSENSMPVPGVPEPHVILLFGSGLLGLATLRRKFRK